jgi:ATP-binding cassette subfamily F protein 3
VSHDRDFLDGLVTKVYEFGGGKVTEHLGGIYDYLRAHQADTIHEALENNTMAPGRQETASAAAAEPVSANKQSYQEHKEQQKKVRKAERAVEESEKKIAKMEARLKELDGLLMDPANAANMELVTEYTSTKHTLDQENERWMELSEALEALR